MFSPPLPPVCLAVWHTNTLSSLTSVMFLYHKPQKSFYLHLWHLLELKKQSTSTLLCKGTYFQFLNVKSSWDARILFYFRNEKTFEGKYTYYITLIFLNWPLNIRNNENKIVWWRARLLSCCYIAEWHQTNRMFSKVVVLSEVVGFPLCNLKLDTHGQ